MCVCVCGGVGCVCACVCACVCVCVRAAPVQPSVSIPQPMVSGVDIPQVTPQAPAAPAAPRTGVNMDDILRQL